MKKQLLSAVLILALLCTVSVCALAEDDIAETTAITWKEVEKEIEAADLDGEYVFFDDVAMKMWIPDGFQPVDLKPEETDSGLIASYTTEDKAARIDVSCPDLEGKNLDELVPALKEEGFSDVEIIDLNGYPMLGYKDEESDSMCAIFAADPGIYLHVMITPYSDSRLGSVANLIVCSLQPETFLEMKWEAVEKLLAEAEIKGDFVAIPEAESKIWIPEQFESIALTQEDRDEGFINYFGTADQNAAVSVVYVDVGGMTLEEYLARVEDIGINDAAIGTVNGNPAVGYTMEENNSASISFATENGCILEITFAPITDEAYRFLGNAILCSVQAA